jgi:DNA-binding GntR family transcriptional regulator
VSISADGYEDLRRAIVNGELLPGERLLEEELSARLPVGRGAVRMALVRLEHDGLVERERHRWARVRRISEDEAVEILEARAALEGLAARQAATVADQVAIDGLRQVIAEMGRMRAAGDLIGLSNVNARLHAAILDASGHETAKRLSRTLSSQIVRFQFRTVLLPGRAERSFTEHSAIVEAIAARDPDAAEQVMQQHLLRVADALRSHAVLGDPSEGAAAGAVQD